MIRKTFLKITSTLLSLVLLFQLLPLQSIAAELQSEPAAPVREVWKLPALPLTLMMIQEISV